MAREITLHIVSKWLPCSYEYVVVAVELAMKQEHVLLASSGDDALDVRLNFKTRQRY